MTIPRVATYRLQFREEMTFDTAVDVVPYLKRLGASHLYVSPIFSAVSGSTHGYDVTDHNEIDLAIGGRKGLERLSEALRRHGMGLVLDIVPNHMAASLENPWWRSVVEEGAQSPYAHHFDIDWGQKLTLPVLGREYREALEAGELSIVADDEGGFALAYFEHRFPLTLSSHVMVRERAGRDEPSGALQTLSSDRAFVDAVHAAQPWRLMYWKDARKSLSYRRFFEVTGLVGVRVEDDHVFDDVHRLILSLVRDGIADGLRVDHIDGLARPTRYLERLRQEVGPDTWLLVEKILGEGEALPHEWTELGIGTTGYEFIGAAADLLVAADGVNALERSYRTFSSSDADIADELRTSKLLLLTRNFAGELRDLATKAAQLTGLDREVTEDAIVELIVAFPVYRTYGEIGGLSAQDTAMLASVVGTAVAAGRAEETAIRVVADLLRQSTNSVAQFRTRFQQLTGPAMAKSVEDTLFYRHNAVIALNEVGAHPGGAVGDPARFHAFMQQQAETPLSLLATSTHDTKRGEDARARLYALTEDSEGWTSACERWSKKNLRARGELEPAVEWLIYQALAGAWPPELAPADAAGVARLRDRFLPYLEKALREAKLRTDWGEENAEYEAVAKSFAASLFDDRVFLQDFASALEPFIKAGQINAISQTLAKLTGPGVPDIYQGSERGDFSLVDPDNRRPVPFAQFAGMAQAMPADPSALLDGRLKQWMVARALACRHAQPDLFRLGQYVPLTLNGPDGQHFVAYLRAHEGAAALVVLPRLTLNRQIATMDAQVGLPAGYDKARFESAFVDDVVFHGGAVSALLGGLPAALALIR